MKKIPTKLHGILDYIVALIFLFMPTMTGMDTDTVPAKVFLYLGIFTIIYSLLTRYELGLLKILPMKAHLGLDIISGFFLMASPWMFGFAGEIFVPYILFGLFEVLAGIMTSNTVGNKTNI